MRAKVPLGCGCCCSSPTKKMLTLRKHRVEALEEEGNVSVIQDESLLVREEKVWSQTWPEYWEHSMDSA
jgi:hypothetical protein